MTQNLISVIVPTFNRADLILKPLNSVYNQTYRPIELIVVDDGSTDRTKEVIQNWKSENESEDFIIKYIFQNNSGAPAARNNGIRNSTGRYLQFLDSDDELLPEKLTLQFEKMKTDNTPICICDYINVDENDNFLMKLEKNYTINQIIRNFIAVLSIGPLIDKTAYRENHLYWNKNIRKLQDKDYFVKLFMVTKTKSYVDQVLFKWTHHSGEKRISNNKELSGIERDILFSILNFQFKNFWLIPEERWPSIILFNFKLLRSWLKIGLILKRFGLR